MRRLVLLLLAAAIAAAWACLPDLVISSPASSTAVCGDGYIDVDAGEQCDPGPGEGGAAAAACPGCRVSCAVGSFLGTIDPSTLHCYFEPNVTPTVTDAISACQGPGGHVVRLVSQKELDFVGNFSATTTFWLGLFEQSSGEWYPNETTAEPGWASNCAGCFPGGGIEGGLALGQRCVQASNLGPFVAVPCGTQVKGAPQWTVCEREPPGTRARACGSNVCFTVMATQGTKSYVAIPQAMGANDAVMACSGLGGHLVVFASAEEREQVAYEIALQGGSWQSSALWIGMSTRADGTWAWDFDGGMSPLPWGVDQPGAVNFVGRAYIPIEEPTPTQSFPDSELAYAGHAADGGGSTDAGAETHFGLCEVP